MSWPPPEDLAEIPSPGLLLDADRVTANLHQMIAVVGGDKNVSRLRPHVKTHKMPDIVRLKIAAGIDCFKVATLAEAEMVAGVGGRDVLVAYPIVGPNVHRFAQMTSRFPETSFAIVCDDLSLARHVIDAMDSSRLPLRTFIDVDCGMHRTGVALGPGLDALRSGLESLDGCDYAGLHVYDGHLHSPSLDERKAAAMEIIEQVRAYDRAHPSPAIVAGGSPTFAIWAHETDWQCSPGTPVFWDAGYGDAYPDLGFEMAISLLTRVISKPQRNRICLDLGYKAVASEMPLERRVILPAIDDARYHSHSEEHLVVETANAAEFSIGQPLMAFPRHICPTVALHAFATVIRDGRVTSERWPVTARDR